jgi:hypothetical protein
MRFDINKIAVILTCAAIFAATVYGIMRPFKFSIDSNLSKFSLDIFSTHPVILEEAENYDASLSDSYWLNSGARTYIYGTSSIQTIFGDLEKGSKWQLAYMASNPVDTENGFHPQNLFRLFTKDAYGDGTYQTYFKITKTILSQSPNRNESNGVLIMLHAKDNDNLYYAGLRVDGTAVIKKKIAGQYMTLGEVPVFAFAKYSKDSNPNLLPVNAWLGVQVKIKNLPHDQEDIALSIDIGDSGVWVPVIHTIDIPQNGMPTLPLPAHAGLRTDFMEVEMKDFMVTSL